MFSYLRLELRARPSVPQAGSIFAAPILRRVLGLALIERFCPFGEPRCQAQPQGGGAAPPPADLCDLARSCPYGVLFAASRSRRPPFALFVPPATEPTEPAKLEVTLFGDACSAYAWVLAAFADAFGRGLGKNRRPWHLEEVWRVGLEGERERLCSADLSALPAVLPPSRFSLASGSYIAPAPVEVRFLSPARLLRDGKLIKGKEPVPFDVLIARILDRFKDLFGPGAQELLDDHLRAGLQADASQVPLLANETDWLEVKDYSARSGAELLMGGKVGRQVYGPDAARFVPILRAGEILHVGKNPTAGCGRIEVRLPA